MKPASPSLPARASHRPWFRWPRLGRPLRRLVQLVALAGFLLGFHALAWRDGEYAAGAGAGALRWLFWLDPVASGGAALAARELAWWLLPGLAILLLTAWLGRFFCGWCCPLGALLAVLRWPLRPLLRRTSRLLPPSAELRLRRGRLVVLAALVMGAVVGVPLSGWADPFGILVRGTAAVDVAARWAVDGGSLWIEDHGPAWLAGPTTTAYRWADAHLLRPGVLTSVAWSGAGLLALIVGLELLRERAWCRWLCPTGALLGLVARWSDRRRVPARTCADCSACAEACPTGAVRPKPAQAGTGGGWTTEDCLHCQRCVADCPKGLVAFRQAGAAPAPAPASAVIRQQSNRREALAAGAALALGAALPATARAVEALGSGRPPVAADHLRPPGVAVVWGEAAFLDRCIRCGLCLQACPSGTLTPGTGLLTTADAPLLALRQAACEPDCVRCGEVCPTGAIPRLTAADKPRHAPGTAAFRVDHCLPWAKDEECLVCEEHCPVAEKAIERRPATITAEDGSVTTIERPVVIADRCLGCGWCEKVCPLDQPAVRVFRPDAPLPPGWALDPATDQGARPTGSSS